MTTQFATRIDSKKKKIIDDLHKKTHIPICRLTEKAFTLLEEYYQHLWKSYKEGQVDDNFMDLVNYSMNRYNKTYKKLAK